uniref:Uncharacterized protein n=1 Tax=Calidris pygmaea TaxID=425635 RepID=A0A8C3JK97_9CHAR
SLNPWEVTMYSVLDKGEESPPVLCFSSFPKNLDCPELTEAFLNSQKAGKEKTDGARRKSLSDNESDDSKSKKKCDSVDKPRGFARGLDPEQIIGAMDNSGKLMFLMESLSQHPTPEMTYNF